MNEAAITTGKATHKRKRALSIALATALTASLAIPFPNAALAAGGSVSESWSQAAEACLSGNTSSQAYSYAYSDESSATAQTTADAETFATNDENEIDLPAKFDLRDPNGDGDRSDSVVTPVKNQLPWGTCWAFSICAASEISILSKSSKTYNDWNLDLSELQLVNSVYTKEGAPESAVGAAQAGEGFHNNSDDPNKGLDSGGHTVYGSSAFSSGIGPVLESAAPYRNKEGIIECQLTEEGAEEPKTLYLTQSQFDAYRDSGANIKRLNWAGNYDTSSGEKAFTDWSTDISLWNTSIYNLENGNVLPETAIKANDEYDHTDLKAVKAIKRELHDNGRGVAMSFCAFEGFYDAEHHSYYNIDGSEASHAVCIVGWDDDFSRTNFNGGKESAMPPGNGAWLIKNSFGSESQDFPDYGESGIQEDGKSTGYYWVSYYDKSITGFESFDFDIESYGDDAEYYVDQYDYLVAEKSICNSYDAPASSANIFIAEGDMALRKVGCTTAKPNTTVLYQIYLLDSDAATPTDPGHSQLAYEFEDTYQYGGYHRSSIGQDSWIAMRKGQRYAVVTTQYCHDDGKWYQNADVASSSFGFEARLNAGESWSSTPSASASAASSDGTQGANEQTAWNDWTEVAAGIKAKDSDLAVDNASIKAFSEIRSWASVDELSALEAAIAKAKAALESTTISADGSDAPEGTSWMTQEQFDAIAAAVEQAETRLDQAGNYKTMLLNTTPSSSEVQASIASLTFNPAFGSAKSEAVAADSNSADTKGDAASKTSSPSTGDDVARMAFAALLASMGAGSMAIYIARRKKDDAALLRGAEHMAK